MVISHFHLCHFLASVILNRLKNNSCFIPYVDSNNSLAEHYIDDKFIPSWTQDISKSSASRMPRAFAFRKWSRLIAKSLSIEALSPPSSSCWLNIGDF